MVMIKLKQSNILYRIKVIVQATKTKEKDVAYVKQHSTYSMKLPELRSITDSNLNSSKPWIY